MALKTKVLVSRINNLSDARYCAGMGVEMIGFNFDQNDLDAISTETYKEIASWISGVDLVAEMGKSSPEFIYNLAQELGFDFIEVEKPQVLAPLKQLDIPLILKLDINKFTNPYEIGQLLNDYENSVVFFNLQATGDFSEDWWIKITEYMISYPIFLGFNITNENVLNLIESTKLLGISLKGGYADILEEIEIDDNL